VDALQVIAEPRRRDILRLIWTDELSAGEIASRFDVTFGAISQHLAVLRDAGFVTVRADRNRRLYRADHDGLGDLASALTAMWGEALDRLAQTVETDRRRRRATSG
jgi:DNA-binding transcriptional ArsR family regulator